MAAYKVAELEQSFFLLLLFLFAYSFRINPT